jgi:acetoacetate decarboxylase
MFTPNPNQLHAQLHTMPAHFGAIDNNQQDTAPTGWYHDVTVIAVPYVTDRDAIASFLPAGFEPTLVPVITVYYCCNKQVDWLAGHGYNMIGVNASVIFTGKDETLEGSYCLAIWENLTDPILRGREVQGIPKVFADIPDHSQRSGKLATNASHFGHKIVDLSIENLTPLGQEQITEMMESQLDKDHPMACRYLPNIGMGGAALNEVTTFPSESIHKEVWVGEGKVDWQSLTWQQNPTQYHIVNAIAELPVVSYLPAVMTKGSVNLTLADKPTRVLKR